MNIGVHGRSLLEVACAQGGQRTQRRRPRNLRPRGQRRRRLRGAEPRGRERAGRREDRPLRPALAERRRRRARAALEDARTASGGRAAASSRSTRLKCGYEATHASYEADAAAGRAVEAGVRVPRTLAEAKGWGLVRRESSADAEAGSSPGSGPLQRALGDFATQFRRRRAQGTTRRRRRFGRLQTHRPSPRWRLCLRVDGVEVRRG